MAKAKKATAVQSDKYVKDVDFYNTFKKTYYDYGMDVIKARALPDVRDGLKPVHRAILTEMLSSHITSNHKTVKVATITGAVIGKWHPHGDSSVEDALAGMAAPWSNTMPSIEIKGNGGSVYGDPHAAGRYIEARLTSAGDAYGHNLKPGIVPYEPNFDDTKMMPKVLPAQLPYLLINGGEGIAVGVASSIPTHNPIEVINAFLSYVQKPKQTIEDLMTIMPGPDFPTKGEIINKSELTEIYKNGFGRIRVRGRLRYEKRDHSLHVYEIPFTAAGSMDTLVDEITTASMETTNKKGRKLPPKIKGITSVLDHSGKDGIDITIKLKRGIDPEAMQQELFAKTRLETTLKFDFSALNDHRLKRYSLLAYFKEYLAFQHQILINEYTTKKQELEKRFEVVSGLIKLQDVINEVVASAKNSNNKKELQEVLQTGKILPGVEPQYHAVISQFSFTPLQAEHIANLPIYKINKMDTAALLDEAKQIKIDLDYANTVINSVAKRKAIIVKSHKKELKKLDPEQFARQTDIIDDQISIASKLEVPESPLYVHLDKYQYLRIEEKSFDGSIATTNKSRLGFFDNHGICWNLHLENTQPTTGNGTLINQLLPELKELVGWSTTINQTPTESEPNYGVFVYQNGHVKLTPMAKFMTKTKTTKVSGGKTDVGLMAYSDVPNDALGITFNDQSFAIDAFSVQGLAGHGKKMLELTDVDHVAINFINDVKKLNEIKPAKSVKASAIVQTGTGVAYFNKNGELNFDWSVDTPDQSQVSADTLFAISYQALLQTKLLFVHTDGTAKIVTGDQFKVATKRTKLQADKKGTEALYIGYVPETMLATYTDGTSKRVRTALISNQSKLGGGVRTFYSKKHQLQAVVDGASSNLECVSLATQPK